MNSRADKALLDWLEDHYDDVMGGKEHLHHEGSGKRTQLEWQEARNLHEQEQQRLIAQLQTKQEDAIKRWMAQGLTREKAWSRWKMMEVKAHERKRMDYAFQKD